MAEDPITSRTPRCQLVLGSRVGAPPKSIGVETQWAAGPVPGSVNQLCCLRCLPRRRLGRWRGPGSGGGRPTGGRRSPGRSSTPCSGSSGCRSSSPRPTRPAARSPATTREPVDLHLGRQGTDRGRTALRLDRAGRAGAHRRRRRSTCPAGRPDAGLAGRRPRPGRAACLIRFVGPLVVGAGLLRLRAADAGGDRAAVRAVRRARGGGLVRRPVHGQPGRVLADRHPRRADLLRAALRNILCGQLVPVQLPARLAAQAVALRDAVPVDDADADRPGRPSARRRLGRGRAGRDAGRLGRRPARGRGRVVLARATRKLVVQGG